MSSPLNISLVQMDCKAGDPERNFAHAATAIAEAARRGSDLVLLPELWSTAYALEAAPTLASPLAHSPSEEGWFARLAGLAAQHGLYIGGSMLESRAGRYYNCFALYGPDGTLCAAYRKVHLFRLMDEEKYLAPGEQTVCLDLPWGKTGLAICYDLRFPELFRSYALAGARLLLIPAEWPHPRRAHWRTLLRARAIENQCFVVACNRVGTTGAASFFGASAVIDPWGETLVEAGEVETLLTVTIDTALVDEVRRRIPVFEDRRPDLY
ncbi:MULTISPECIES: carbon-nitrogen family hydrolase [Caldilinea]|jgi:omega-amidase|nr:MULTISPECIES: carbon-nitrogen family hydrolase [Caldilinea]MBO9392695.1 carbon-nitrogen family hydrolase [Caldilinea sp.]GIV72027.1 MAG: hydrolase [Caldilinea sp.]